MPPPPRSWVQVLGRVAAHDTDGQSTRLTGSGQRLLSVLVATGAEGASAERIAEALWSDRQPNPWRPALRMAIARLRKQLPDGWDVTARAGSYRLHEGEGWVDAWRLESVAGGTEAIAEDDLAWMLAGEPFPDVDVVDVVGPSMHHLRLMQIAAVERYCAQAPPTMRPETCSALCGILRHHPFNERLAATIAHCLDAAGHGPEAREAIVAFVDSFEAEFDWVPPDLAHFLEVPTPMRAAAGEAPHAAAQPAGATRHLPRELLSMADTPMLGRDAELEQLLDTDAALLTGASGAGKSRLLAALILADDVSQATYVVGDDRLDLPLGPFVIAIPELRETLVDELDEPRDRRDDGSSERAASTRAWRIVLEHFEQLAQQRPQRLVIDDAHLLDRASFGLLRLLIRSTTAAAVRVTVSGRSDVEDPAWADFVRDTQRAGLPNVELIGLDLETIERIVFDQFPAAMLESRRALALEVLEASGGLPAVALPLVAAADASTLSLPEKLSGTSVLGTVAAGLNADSREIAAAAAVLGHQFSIGALIALVGLHEDEVFRGLDDLWAAGFIEETDDPDQIRFRHLLLQQAFLEAVPNYRRGQLHRHAAGLTSDPHERARHQASAGSLISPQVAADSLLESAQILARNRQWRRVVTQLRRAEALVGDQLDVASLTLWATALDLSGADGVGPRRAAFRRACAAKDWPAALGAATSGLPEAERPDGDPERITMLESIPRAGLPTDLQFELVLELGRQHAVAGRHELALGYAEASIDLAEAPDEIGLSHVIRWTATRQIDPRPHQLPTSLLEDTSLAVRTRIMQMSAIGAVEGGDYAHARTLAIRFHDLAAELGDPLRIWQSMVLRAMFEFDDGRLEAARAVADRALEYAQLHGLQQGTSTWAGQLVHLHEIRNELSKLDPLLDAFRPNMARSSLASAALLLCQFASGVGDPADGVRKLVIDALDRPRSSSTVVLAMLAPLIRILAPELAPDTRTALEPFAEGCLIVGFGVANMGPTARYLARLASEPDDATALLHTAVELSDADGPLLARVMSRMDLAAYDGTRHLDEARDLAAGTDLADLVEKRVR